MLAEIEQKRREQTNEIEIALELQQKKSEEWRAQIMPADKPKRWWQRYARPNYAKKLMQEDVMLDVSKYFAARREEIQKKANEQQDGAERAPEPGKVVDEETQE